MIGPDAAQRIVLTDSLVSQIISETHQLYGHIGVKKCVAMVSQFFFYLNLKGKGTRIVRKCDSCQRNKSYTASTYGKSSPIVPKGPRELVSIDFCGPLPTSRGGVKHILAVLDAFSKFVVLYAIKRADARTTIRKIFEDYIPRYGKPSKIQSDHRTQFTSGKWLEGLSHEGIPPVFSAIRHPQSNLVERVNKEIGRLFRTLVSNQHTAWATWLPFIQSCINESDHDTTEFTPVEIHLNQLPKRFWESWITLPPRVVSLPRDR